MANIASLVPQSVSIPRPDNSWLDGIADSLGGLAQELGARKSFGALADRIGGVSPAAAPQGGFLSRLTGGAATQPRASGGRSMAISDVNPSVRDGIIKTASSLGVDPVDLATAISYETGGTFDPTKSGPTTQWGTHRGLIQFGEPQAQKYGVNWDDPIGSQLGENGAVAAYLRDTGVKPGAGLLDIYSAINAGGVGRYNASDANNGGAPGTVRDKVEQQMGGHRQRALALLGNDYASAAPQTAADAVSAMADGSLASGFNGDPAVAPAQQAIAQAAPAQQGGNIIAPGITPVQRGGVDPGLIQFMLRDPNLRETGLKLWATNARGQDPTEAWQFINLPDGTLARANQQTGQVERLGTFAKQQEQYRVLSQEERAAAGIPPEDNRPYQISPQGQISAVGGVGQSTNAGVEARNREELARQYGIDPNSAEGQRFILTGTLPSSDKGVTAGDREAIRDADDAVQTGENTLGLLDKALELSPKAYEGWGADARAIAGSQIGLEGANATREFDNIVKEQALGQLKQIFGGAPTEGERAILLEIQGASSQPQAVRENILRRARALVERKIAYNRDRANELRGGTYYRPRDDSGAAPAPKQNGQRKTSTGVQWSIEE